MGTEQSLSAATSNHRSPTHSSESALPHDLTNEITLYRDHPIACGGFADVRKGSWKRGAVKIEVAIKSLRLYSINDEHKTEKIVKRLHRELRIWKGCEHEHILPFFGVASGYGPWQSMVCQWMEHGNINDYLQRFNLSLHVVDRLYLVHDILAGLAYLHSLSIVHGDLTGGNILIDGSRKARLSDFGLSQVISDVEGCSYLTSTVSGAYRWTAPELYGYGDEENIAITMPCDIYSYGSIVLQILSGKVPYHYVKRELTVLFYVKDGRKPKRPIEITTEAYWDLIGRCWAEASGRPTAWSLLPEVKCLISDAEQVRQLQEAQNQLEREEHMRKEQLEQRAREGEKRTIDVVPFRPSPANSSVIKGFTPGAVKAQPKINPSLEGPKIFAIIVGISEYLSPEIPNLSGCIVDALSVQSYLVDHLGVPLDYIVMLKDAGATRQAILNAFQNHFVSNSAVSRDDALLFYFAGHGSRCVAPDGWATENGAVETISPHDENAMSTPNIFGIPDRTLSALLRKTAENHGNNITMILDCCHSGNGARGGEVGNERGHRSADTVPSHLDREIWGSNMRHLPTSGFLGSNMNSHVLLAACRQDESAHEIPANDGLMTGAFTYQLLKALRQISLQQTTYAALLDLLPSIPNQHPQCEGDNKHRHLFTTISDSNNHFFLVKKAFPTGLLEVDAGKVHGVTEGTEFILYTNARETPPSFGTFHVDSLRVASSTLTTKKLQSTTDIPRISYALVSWWASSDAKLAVFFDTSSISAAFATMISPLWMMTGRLNIIRTSQPSEADVILHESTDSSGIVELESFIDSYHTICASQDRICHILQAASHFKLHFSRTNEHHPLRPLVTMELHRLAEVDSSLYKPIGPNRISEGEARIVLSDDHFGVTLRNNSGRDLFPSLFYFDPADFSIQRWYVPPSGTMAAPLCHGSALNIGFGNNNGMTVKFDLKPYAKAETGFLVLFLSTEYADMKHIEQSGVSDHSGKMQTLNHAGLRDTNMIHVGQSSASGRGIMMPMGPAGLWDTVRARIMVARTSDDLQRQYPLTSLRRGAKISLRSPLTWLSTLYDSGKAWL